MSASTEKKNRSSARLDGTDKRTVAERKAAEKERKSKIKWISVAVLIVLVFAAVIYINSGLFFRQATAVTIDYEANDAYGLPAGSRSFSVAEVNYVYGTQFMNISSYASLFGLDTTKSFDTQVCTLADKGENYTWDDYFMDQSVSYLRQIAVLADYAEKNGIKLGEDELAAVDKNIESLKSAAETNGYSLDDYIYACYGKGVNEDVVRSMMELEQLAAKVETEQRATYTYTQEQLSEKYASVADDYDKFSFDYYYFAAKTEGTDENGNANAPTEESLAEAKAQAEKMRASLAAGGDFTELVKAYEDANGIEKPASESGETKEAGPTVVEAAAGNTISSTAGSSSGTLYPEALEKWVKSADRTSGEIAVVEIEGVGYYVVRFNERDNNQAPTEESGDMNYCDYVADALLRNEATREWEDGIVGTDQKITSSTGFAARYVGR